MLIESQGEISLRTSSPSGGDIIATYKGKDLRLHYSVTDERGELTGQKWYLQYAQSAQPPGDTGWIPYAADTRNGIGVFLWKSTVTVSSADTSQEFWEAIGFSLTTGEMVGHFLDDGSFEDLARMRERFLSGNPASRSDFTYGNPDQSEISSVFAHFDDIINPKGEARSQATKISKPEAFKENYADIITNYNPKTDQPIQIDLGTFDGAAGRLKIAKKSKQVAKLAKKNIDFIYDREQGYLYYNENGTQADLGVGGIFAILEGSPKVRMGNFEFI